MMLRKSNQDMMAQLSLSGLSLGQETPLATPLTAQDTDNTSDDSNPLAQSIYRCRAPIASLDCMDEFSGNSHQIMAELTHSTSNYLMNHTSLPPSIAPGLKFQNLGKSGLRVSNVALGLWCPADEELLQQIVSVALQSGINTFDFSEAHTGVNMESMFGNVANRMNIKRSSINIITKIYWSSRSDERGLNRKHIIESIDDSMRRLQVSYIDVVCLHKFDPLCPMEELVRTMTYLIERGKIMYWGTARWSPHEIMEAFTHCRQFNCITPVVDQTEYHLFCREKAELYLPEIYHRIGVGTMVWSQATLGKGMGRTDVTALFARSKFNRKFSTFSYSEDDINGCEAPPSGPRAILDTRTHGDKLLELINLASNLNCTLTQLSIAWCLKNEAINCLLIGACNLNQLREQIHSLTIVSQLTPLVMTEIERIVSNKPQRPPMISTLAMRNLQSPIVPEDNSVRVDMTINGFGDRCPVRPDVQAVLDTFTPLYFHNACGTNEMNAESPKEYKPKYFLNNAGEVILRTDPDSEPVVVSVSSLKGKNPASGGSRAKSSVKTERSASLVRSNSSQFGSLRRRSRMDLSSPSN